MSFLYESRQYTSEKNGLIHCQKRWGKWFVKVDKIDQTSPYVTAMWKRGLRRLPKRTGFKRILVLGLGAGSCLGPIYRYFPKAQLTAVEWDPVMIEIAKELKFIKPGFRLSLIIDDALMALPRLKKRFSLIIIDLFRGSKPAPILYQPPFISFLQETLSSDGYLLLNAFGNSELLAVFDQQMSRLSSWRFKFNKLALYTHRGRGKIGDPLPNGYVHYKQSPDYLLGGRPAKANISLVGREGGWGLRWHFGPLWFEGYESDQEPEIQPHQSRRLIIWQPLSRLDKPKGWHRSWLQMNFRQTGFSEIKNPADYWQEWNSHAKRHRQRWLSQNSYTISEAGLDEFIRAFQKTRGLPSFLRSFSIKMLQWRKNRHNSNLRLFAVRDNIKGEISAGLAVIDLPEIGCSNHLISFILPQAKASSAGVGLIDYWFRESISRFFRFLNFGTVWTPGDPRSWKGFSNFKKQFNLYLIHRPNPLIKFVKKLYD